MKKLSVILDYRWIEYDQLPNVRSRKPSGLRQMGGNG